MKAQVPPAFCAGADLKERTASGGNPAATTSGPNRMSVAMSRLRSAKQPTIAAVKGPARAGGAIYVNGDILTMKGASPEYGEALVVQNGAEAWEVLQSPQAPPLAICDWMM